MPEVPALEVHLAGTEVRYGRLLRQRCAWCGTLMVDLEATRDGAHLPDPWAVGALVGRMDGVWVFLAPGGSAPGEGCCLLLDPAATR
jgi:hypothetical protein